MKIKLYSKIFLFCIIFTIWLVLGGFDFYSLIVGLICGITIILLFGDICLQNEWSFRKPLRYLWFLYYIPVFIFEVIKANLDVAYRILMPEMPIKPGIVKIKTKLKNDSALTLLANSITLTPGTLSVDVNKENGYIYVHWIYVRSKNIEEATQKIAKKFEDILIKIFG